MENDEFLEYLKEKWGDKGYVSKLSNGSYYFVNKDYTYDIYIPESCTSGDAKIWNYIPGSGDMEYDGKIVTKTVTSDNPPNCIVTTSRGCSDSYNSGLETVNLLSEIGINTDKVCMSSFSQGFGGCIKSANELQKAYPDLDLSILVNDGYGGVYGWEDTSLTSQLAESKTPIYFLCPPEEYMTEKRSGYVYKTAEFFFNNDLNINFLTSEHINSQSHFQRNLDMVLVNLPEYMLGVSELNKDYKYYDDCNFKLYKYTGDKTGEEISLDELTGYLYAGDKDLYTIRMKSSDIKAVMNGTGSVVATNTITVVEGINAIARELNNSEACINPSKVSMSSTAGIPGALYKCQDVYLGMSTNLITSLISELNVIQSMAQTYYDMDKSLSASASTLAGSGSGEVSTSSIDIKLNSIIDSRPNSKISFNSSFLYDLPNAVAGKVYKSEVESALSGGLHSNFASEIESAKSTKTQIDNFASAIGSSLKGEAWNKVKNNLNNYSNLMDERIKSANTLEEAMKEALTLVLEYMEDYDELDDSKLPEIRDTLEKIKEEIENANMVINKTVVQEETDENGKVKKYTRYMYSEESRKKARNYIVWAEEEIIKIEKLIVKLEGLAEIMRRALDIVNAALMSVYESYGKQISNIVTGNPTSFTMPTYTRYEAKEIAVYQEKEKEEEKIGFFAKTEYLLAGGDKKYGSIEDYQNKVQLKYNPEYSDIKDLGKKLNFELDTSYDLLKPTAINSYVKIEEKLEATPLSIEKNIETSTWNVKDINPNSIDNPLGIPYYNQNDYGPAMSKAGCGYSAAAMIVSGLSKDDSIDPISFYETAKGGKEYNPYSSISSAQFDVLEGANGPYGDSAKQMYQEMGITTEHLNLRGDPHLSATLQSHINEGKALLVSNGSHDVLIAPSYEEGKVVFYDPYFSKYNGIYTIDELIDSERINRLTFGVAYSSTADLETKI